MTDVFTKVSDSEIKVIKTETKEVANTYNYSFLLQQKKDIQAQKDRDNALRDAELLEVDNLIAECKKLGIVEKVEEEKIPK